jgi:hypothetical protein
VSDEEEHVEAAQKDRLDREEVTGDDACRLRAQELAPAETGATRRRLQAGASEQPPALVAETMKPSFASSPQIRR